VLAHKTASGSQEVRHAIERYLLPRIPPGPLQDGDCLDLVIYLLGECGLHEQGAEMARACALSGSTEGSHVLKLAFDYWLAMDKQRRGEEGLALIAELAADMVSHECPLEWTKEQISQGMKRTGMDSRWGRRLKQILRSCGI